MYPNYQTIKILENYFQNMNCFCNCFIQAIAMNCLDKASFSSNPSQVLILQYPMSRACLPPLPSLSNFTLANQNPSSTQSLSGSSSVSLFCPTPFYHTPQLLYVIDHMPSQANQIYYQVIYKSWYLIGQTCYLLPL